ncbi:DUF2894 domain-containing protein [Aquabacterium sp.]|uniref:DUF2894 domain-containing protein n=1 Tax=Aquabacterium sp. TaxID=1872578 RepID=UPI0037845AB6
MVQQEAVAAMLAAWRARGLQQRDPVPYHRLEALARRAAALQGRTRALLDERLAVLLAQCAQRLSDDQACDAAARAPGAAVAGHGPLAELVRQLAGTPPPPATPLPGAPASPPTGGAAVPAAPVELKALRQHRRTWSRLHVERRLSQSKAQAPDQAGPLHSQALVVRTLSLMRELSPEYLEHFIAEVDTLLWLEDAHGGSALLQKDVLRGAAEAAAATPARAQKPTRRRIKG